MKSLVSERSILEAKGAINVKKTAVISGASRGIGEAIARKLAAENFKVCLLARNEQDLARIRNDIESSGGEAMTLSVDLSDPNSLDKVFSKITDTLGSLDLVICNAGCGKFSAALETSVEDWDAQMNLNARSSFILSKLASSVMVHQGRGQIIFIASDAATRTFAQGSSYCASKYAQYAYASALRREVRASGIKVTVVLPGLVASYFNDATPDSEEKLNWLRPEDVADAVYYAASAPNHVVVDEITLHPMCQEY